MPAGHMSGQAWLSGMHWPVVAPQPHQYSPDGQETQVVPASAAPPQGCVSGMQAPSQRMSPGGQAVQTGSAPPSGLAGQSIGHA